MERGTNIFDLLGRSSKPQPYVNKSKDRRLAGKRRVKQRRELSKISRMRGV